MGLTTGLRGEEGQKEPIFIAIILYNAGLNLGMCVVYVMQTFSNEQLV